MESEPNTRQNTVHILRIAARDASDTPEYSKLKLQRKLIQQLAEELPAVLTDAGCVCLVKKLALSAADSEEDSSCCNSPSRVNATLQLFGKLGPLSRALREAGYYDHALTCATAAKSVEPTWDLNLLRAYLLLALGDNEEACAIYNRAIRKLGKLPAEEIERIRKFANEHTGEEDLADILEQLCSSCEGNPTSTG